MLHEFLTENNLEIISRTRAKVAARRHPVPTEAEMKNGVPLFLGQLVDRLQHSTTGRDARYAGDNMKESASIHGGELLNMGFSIGQVVHGYGDVCQAITELADETSAPITVDEFKRFNMCQDDATAEAVTEYERQRDRSVADKGMERQGILAHEMGNRVAAALIAFNLLQKGVVAIGGSTGAVLGRNLSALRLLVNNSLAGVRLEAGIGEKESVSVVELVAEVDEEAVMVGETVGIEFVAEPVEPGAYIHTDRQVLSAALSNLLQNAFKFSRPRTRVSLRTVVSPDRVVFEVEDHCGGLPAGAAEGLFAPFAQRNANRSGLGLGLSITSRGVAAIGGRIGVRDLPGKGCVFWIDLPRLLPL